MTIWTQEKIDKMVSIKDNHSMQEIADIIGATKNAVIGKMNRMRRKGLLPPVNREVKPSAVDAIKIEAAIGFKPAKVTTSPKIKIKPKYISPKIKSKSVVFKDDKIGKYKLDELTSKQCKFPHGDTRAHDFGFCGADIERGSYCKEHYIKCHVKNKDHIKCDKPIDRNW